MQKNRKVLVVDDNRVFADVLCEILNTREFDAESCYDGEDALKKAREGAYDCMCIDVVMPGMSGIKVLKEIRKISPQVRVILMTGYCIDDDMRTEMDGAEADIINKPFEVEDIMDRIRGTVEK